MYPDDIRQCSRLKSINMLNEDLQRLESRLRGNKLSMNVIKTKSLLIGSMQKEKDLLKRDKKLALQIRERDIVAVPEIKYPGVYIDVTLNRKKTNPIDLNQSIKSNGLLNYSKQLFPSETLMTLYTSKTYRQFRLFIIL